MEMAKHMEIGLMEHKSLLRPDEVAALLNLTQRTVYRMIRDGRLPGVKVGRAPWRIPRAGLEAFLEQ
jgi:excisionase family DNA binding protein